MGSDRGGMARIDYRLRRVPYSMNMNLRRSDGR